jgi:hypothetical protein
MRRSSSAVLAPSKHSLLVAVCTTGVMAFGSVFAATETYVRATVDENRLRIVTATGKTIVPKPITRRDTFGTQVGFDRAAISTDGRVVGWVALFPNCCTSYPIPLALVLYSNGKTRTLTGIGLPIWRWCFEANGTQVAFEQETVHGGLGVHYELRDTESGDLIAQYSPEVGPDNQPLEKQNVPGWVTELDKNSK